jgi:ABC-type transport system involved in multi-copper enzyme maturation permease subunit
MLTTLINKELKSIIQSPKFVGSFAVCSILILLSVYVGIVEYRAAVAQHEAATNLVDEELRQATSWDRLTTKSYRAPDPMQIFVSGVNYDIGRWSSIGNDEGVKLRHSAYSDDPIFAVFRFVDFAFIVMFVMSLIAIQFTYDAVNGERESGTLKLVFSNAVPRAKYLIAKCVGSWLGLALPLGIPVLLSLLLVIGMGVPLDSGHWVKLGILIALSLLLFTFFIFLGVFMSTVTRRSSVSFLVALLVWVGFVMIIPRAGVMAAGGLIDVPRDAQIEAQRDVYANEKWAEFIKGMTANDTSCAMTRSKVNDSLHLALQNDINRYEAGLREENRPKKINQENLAWGLARLSPASAYQLAAMSLAGTSTQAKATYEESMEAYRTQFSQYVAAKQEASGQTGGIRIALQMDDNGQAKMSVDASRDRDGLDVSDRPRFSPPTVSLAEAFGPTIPDFGVLCFDILLVFAAAFVSFLKYDLR